ncbi:uncharacterized protein AB675_5957 [Cyphellophora attinorum]|uniref:Elongator complex protein 6 n=1 Tax=Cyphellophora attinorum TaxID=1664694 RepID=A0A0N1NYF1_9EURO|nr:uncharacterized protein AB675_5957 [Phialophora attinorum]KPI38830.1 hypothetical protein AB675_5957 [Phialophora attinorum]
MATNVDFVLGSNLLKQEQARNTSKPNATSFLRSVATNVDPIPSVFVIAPPTTQTTLAIATHLEAKVASTPTATRPDSIALLSQIQLLQYLSLSGLAESIGDVSAARFERSSSSRPPAAATISPPPPGILLIQGLSPTLTEAARRHGATHTAAIASNLLHSLTHLSRTYSNLLVLVELDAEVQKPSAAINTHAAQAALDSAFTSPRGEILLLGPAPTPSMAFGGSTASVSAILEQSMDTLIAVHDGFGRTREHDRQEKKKGGPDRGKSLIIEVVKDRAGGEVARWCVWVQ